MRASKQRSRTKLESIQQTKHDDEAGGKVDESQPKQVTANPQQQVYKWRSMIAAIDCQPESSKKKPISQTDLNGLWDNEKMSSVLRVLELEMKVALVAAYQLLPLLLLLMLRLLSCHFIVSKNIALFVSLANCNYQRVNCGRLWYIVDNRCSLYMSLVNI